MSKENNVIELLTDIRSLLAQNKKVLNVDDLASYTGLSKSKIYKLSMLKLIPTGSNEHIRNKFFSKEAIDEWLLGSPNVSDEYLEQQFNQQLLKNRKA